MPVILVLELIGRVGKKQLLNSALFKISRCSEEIGASVFFCVQCLVNGRGNMAGKDIIIALWAVFLWSLNIVVQKVAITDLSVFIFSFLRVGLVFPLLFFYPKPEKSLWKYMLCGLFMGVLYFILFGYGLKSDIGAGLSAFIVQLQVFFGILCGFLILGEKPKLFQIIGILISCLGVYALKATSSDAEFPMVAVLLLIGSCFCFGMGISLSKKLKVGGSMRDITWLSMASAVPLLFICFVVEGPLQTVDMLIYMPTTVFLTLLFATVISTIWATYLWLGLLQRAPISSVVPFMLLLPIFSNIISAIVLGERLTSLQMVAGAIIIVGVMFAQGLHMNLRQLLERAGTRGD